MLKTLKINQQRRYVIVTETDNHANLGTVIGIDYGSIACIIFRDLQTNQHRGLLKAKNHCHSSYKCPHPRCVFVYRCIGHFAHNNVNKSFDFFDLFCVWKRDVFAMFH